MADPETGYLQSSEDQLSEEIFTDPTKFLRAIHPRFLENVYPIESGLVDELRSSSVFDSDNEGSIRGEKTRRDKARKCWSLLNKVLPHQFPSCYSALKSKCGLVVGGKTFRRDDGGGGEGCVRHVIQRRMSLRRFADVFPVADGCSYQEYTRMMEGSDLDNSLWDKAFELCSRNKDNVVFIAMMETTLRTTHIPLPEELQALVAKGFPCLCQETVPPTKAKKRKRSKKKKKKSHKRLKKFHAVTDCHSDTDKHMASTLEVIVSPKDSSSLTATDLGSAAEASSSAHTLHKEDIHMLSSQESKEETTQNEDAHQDCCFESQEQKDTFLKRLEELNTAVTKASSIKALFQEAAGIQLELAALTQPTRADPSETKQLEEKGKAHRLRAKSRDLQIKLENAHREASLTLRETEKMATATTKLPDHHLKALSVRRELLASEVNQADDFYHQSAEIFRQLNLDSIINQEQTEENAAESNPDVLPSIQVCFEKVDQQIAEQDADSYDGEWESYDSFSDEGSEHDFDSEEEDRDGFDFDNEEVYEIDDSDIDEEDGDGYESDSRDTDENNDDIDGGDGDGYESDSRDTDENNDDIDGGDEYFNGEDAADYDNDSDTNDGSNFHDDNVNDGSDFDDDVDFDDRSDFDEDCDEF